MNEQQRTKLLLLGLAGAIGLYLYSRTQSGQQAASDTVENVLDTLDTASSRITSLAMSRGYTNNNPGNIRFIQTNPWNGQIGSDDRGFGVYDTMANGVRAMGHQLIKYFNRGQTSIAAIIAGIPERNLPGWAPSSENDTVAYYKDVANQLGVDPFDAINVPSRLDEVAQAIARHENGYISDAVNWQWVYLS